MALAHSTGLKNGILGTGFKPMFDTTGRLLVYSGAAPVSADLGDKSKDDWFRAHYC